MFVVVVVFWIVVVVVIVVFLFVVVRSVVVCCCVGIVCWYSLPPGAQVEELELNDDAQSIDNLLTFLEKTFNGGSDFNEPVTRCLQRLTDAKWANSDILLVSDGELRQPAHEVPTIMHTLADVS